MQVSRLSLLLGLLVLFLLLDSPFLLSLLLFSPFSVRSILITCHLPSILVHVCCPLFCFCFPSPVLNWPQLTTFFVICAYTNMQITVCEYACINMLTCICISANKYFKWMLIYKHVIWTAMHRKVSSVIESENIFLSL